MAAIHLTPFSPPRKKMRLPQHPDFPFEGQLPMPTFSGNHHLLGNSNPFGCLPEKTPAGMQGARHAHYGLSLSDIHLNKLQSGLFPAGFPPLDRVATPTKFSNNSMIHRPSMSESVSCLLTMSHSPQSTKKLDDVKPQQLMLFGKPILTEQQISLSSSGDNIPPVARRISLSDESGDKMANHSYTSESALHQQSIHDTRHESEAHLETVHCKVFMDSEDVGRTLDFSQFKSYEELYTKLADLFGIENSETLNRVLYRDATGSVKHIGDEPLSNFVKTARRLTIIMDSGSNNVAM